MKNKNSGDVDRNIRLIRNGDARKVDVLINGKIFTSYIYSEKLKKPVLYPIETANGTIITRGFSLDPRPGERVDRPHHIGLWFNYGDVNGLDFWNSSGSIPADKKSNYGAVRHKEINNIASNGNKGMLKVTMEWINSEGEVLLNENTTFIFRETDNKRLIDRVTKLTALDKILL